MAEQGKPRRQELYVDEDKGDNYYANNVQVTVTPFDMRLRFALVDDVTENAITYRHQVTVYLAPRQARALRNLLLKKGPAYDAIWAGQEPPPEEQEPKVGEEGKPS